MTRSKLRVGFLGLGLMGGPMAVNIIKNGYPLSVFNRNPKKTLPLKKLGAKVVNSPKELGLECDVIISMVTGPKDVREVYLGKDGVAQTAKEGTICIDMSTIGPTSAREIYQDLKECGIYFLDAPVTGSTDRAKSGELTIFIGGERSVFDSAQEVLSCMGKDLHYMGKSGAGQAIKLVNNLIVGESMVALSEGFLLGDSLGLKRKQVMEAFANAFALSPSQKSKMPNFVQNKFPTAFSVLNIKKDLGLALKENTDATPLPSLKLADKLYKKAIEEGYPDEDLSVVIKVLDSN
jgi:3-hydroxyisobutyrate dehydrogenase